MSALERLQLSSHERVRYGRFHGKNGYPADPDIFSALIEILLCTGLNNALNRSTVTFTCTDLDFQVYVVFNVVSVLHFYCGG